MPEEEIQQIVSDTHTLSVGQLSKNFDTCYNDENSKAVLLKKYETLIGYSSELFDNEEWNEFYSFCMGYILKITEDEQN